MGKNDAILQGKNDHSSFSLTVSIDMADFQIFNG